MCELFGRVAAQKDAFVQSESFVSVFSVAAGSHTARNAQPTDCINYFAPVALEIETCGRTDFPIAI